MKSARFRLKQAAAFIKGIFKPSLDLSGRQIQQKARHPCDREELLIEPEASELLLTNSLQRTYAREMVHDGYKHIIWPKVPTSAYRNYQALIPFNPGQTIVVWRVWGRGELVILSLNADDGGFQINLLADSRNLLNLNIGQLQRATDSLVIPGFGFCSAGLFDAVGTFRLILWRPERFTKSLALSVTNTAVGPQNLTEVWIWTNMHEVKELLEAANVPLDPTVRTQAGL